MKSYFDLERIVFILNSGDLLERGRSERNETQKKWSRKEIGMTKQTTKHRIGTGAGWLTAWLELPKIEKELTRRSAKSAQQSQRRDICAQNALQAQQ